MSESEGDRVARSLALEQAYVHEVYEQCAESTVQNKLWPRIYQFLEDLEPGALVCDVGCGNGKYLNVKHGIFSVGADRCKNLSNVAREGGNEVLLCDNLTLPFRDESFDAVLSIAVVHHFSTTERRVRALKELARVLRIGGRLIISVWAMEQKHRKFKSQDVLIPWPKTWPPRFYEKCNSACRRLNGCSSAAHRHPLSSRRRCQNEFGETGKSNYWIDPIFSPSPSTSSLSSPNETCYSFFRRALQKLAGGRRGSRAWFLENWQNRQNRKSRRSDKANEDDDEDYDDDYDYDFDDETDVNDIPIELRRLEDPNCILPISSNQAPGSDNLSVKSKSLCDILEIERLDLVRSRSSIPGFSSASTCEKISTSDEMSITSSSFSGSKPRFVKQKSHVDDAITEIDAEERALRNTAIQRLLDDFSESQGSSDSSYSGWSRKRVNVRKQSSMNEELMSTARLEEKERLRQNITKQTSLGEDVIYKNKTFEALKETIYARYNASKSLQLLTSGLTNRIKQSTSMSFDRSMSGTSIRNGFVRILQNWKSTESENKPEEPSLFESGKLGVSPDGPHERRLSREDGSDSSKDSSLQSDTSVDSEDSFASVIYVPKQPQKDQETSSARQLIEPISVMAVNCGRLNITSAPPSPRVKYAVEGPQPKGKFVAVSPLLKQFPASSKSLPPSSPPGLLLSPRTLKNAPLRPFFFDYKKPVLQDDVVEDLKTASVPQKSPLARKQSSLESKLTDVPEVKEKEDVSVESVESVVQASSTDDDKIRKIRLSQIKELLKQKPEFATRIRKSSVFPLVRRASLAVPGRLDKVTKILPRLLSLEIFNPETDDAESDSSGVSSPESVGSVISVISDKRYISKIAAQGQKDAKGTETNAPSPEVEKDTSNADKDKSSQENLISEQTLMDDIDRYCRESKMENYSSASTESLQKCNGSNKLSEKMPYTKSHSVDAKDNNTQHPQSVKLIPKTDDQEKPQPCLTYGNSIESSDIGDSIENTISESSLEEETSSSFQARNRMRCSSSSATSSIAAGAGTGTGAGTSSCRSFRSSGSFSSSARHKSFAEQRIPSLPSRIAELRKLERSISTGSSSTCCTLSNFSSQESLPSDPAERKDQAKAIAYHQYYHVFREGELDQLINKYVENLHIISSYYDHASWCIVAEKIQVWTI